MKDLLSLLDKPEAQAQLKRAEELLLPVEPEGVFRPELYEED